MGNEEGMSWETTDVLSADTTDVFSADTTDVLSAGTTGVLSAEETSVRPRQRSRRDFFPAKNMCSPGGNVCFGVGKMFLGLMGVIEQRPPAVFSREK